MKLRTCVLGLIIVAATFAPATAQADDTATWTPSASEGLTGLFASQPLVSPSNETGHESGYEPGIAPSLSLTQPQGPEPHPTPEHTGFRALISDTGRDFMAFPRRRSTWVILGVGAGLAALAHPVDDNVNGHLAGSVAVGRFFAPGKFLGAAYTQIAVSLGLYAIGRWVMPHAEGEPKTNRVSHLGFDLLRAQFLSQAVVQGMKYTIRRNRPTGECCSFPSGHAATAFAVASVLERHLGYRFAWPTVLSATYVATSRLHDNRHFLSDVVFGAAIGTATGWTVVGRHGRNNYALLPQPVRGGMMLAFVRTPDEGHRAR